MCDPRATLQSYLLTCPGSRWIESANDPAGRVNTSLPSIGLPFRLALSVATSVPAAAQQSCMLKKPKQAKEI